MTGECSGFRVVFTRLILKYDKTAAYVNLDEEMWFLRTKLKRMSVYRNLKISQITGQIKPLPYNNNYKIKTHRSKNLDDKKGKD